MVVQRHIPQQSLLQILHIIQHRSRIKQIEYCSRIGKIAEENPDLPYAMIRDILIADQDAVIGEYAFN